MNLKELAGRGKGAGKGKKNLAMHHPFIVGGIIRELEGDLQWKKNNLSIWVPKRIKERCKIWGDAKFGLDLDSLELLLLLLRGRQQVNFFRDCLMDHNGKSFIVEILRF